MAVYGLSSTFGPPMALVVTGYIGLNAGWRMIFWVLMAMSGAVWILLVVSVPETRHAIILQKKARRVRTQLRKENLPSADSTVDIHASGRKGLHELFAITLTRPFRFLFSEPITTFSLATMVSSIAWSTCLTRPFHLFSVLPRTSLQHWTARSRIPRHSDRTNRGLLLVPAPRAVLPAMCCQK